MMNKATPKPEAQQACNTKRHLVIEIPKGCVRLGPDTIAMPIEDCPPIFDGKALLEFTHGIPEAIVDTLCEQFTDTLQRQVAFSKFHTHVEQVTGDGSNG